MKPASRLRSILGGVIRRQSAVGPQWFRTHLEPLEVRSMLSASDLLVSTYDDSAGNSVLHLPTGLLPLSSSVATGDHGLGKAQGLAVAPDGSFYVSSDVSGAVLHYSAAGAYMNTLSVSVFAPGTLVFGPNGDLYIGDLYGDTITEYNTSTSSVVNVQSLGYAPGGIAFATDGSNSMIVGDLDAQSLVIYPTAGSPTTIDLSGSNVNPAAVLPEANGSILIADLDFGFQPTLHHQVMLYNPVGATLTPFINLTNPVGTGSSAGFPPQPTSLAYDRDGNLLVGVSADHNGNGAVEKFNINNGSLMDTVVAGLGTPTGLAVVGNNLRISTYDSTDGNSVVAYQIAPIPTAASVATGDHGLGKAQGLAVAPDGSFYVSSDVSGAVLHYSAAGAYMNTLSVSVFAPGTLVFGPNGDLYIGDLYGDTITEYNTSTSSVVNVQSLGYAPGGIAFATDGSNSMIVGDLDAQSLVIYPTAGSPTTIDLSGSNVNPAAVLPEANGSILIADLDFGFQPTLHHQVMLYNPVGATLTPFINLTNPVGTGSSAGFPPQPTSLAYDRDGNLLVGVSADHNGNGAVEKFNINNGSWMSTAVAQIGTPTGVVVTGTDLLVSTYDDTNGNSVLRYQIAPIPTAASVATGDHGLGKAQGLAVAPDGSFYVSSDVSGAVLHYSAAGAYMNTLSVSVFAPGTLVFGPNGDLYIGDLYGDTITEYNTSTSSVVNVQSLGYAPGGIAFATDGSNSMIVGDLDAQSLVIYPTAGSPTTIDLSGSNVNPAAVLPEANGSILIADLDFGFQPTLHHQVMLYNPVGATLTPFINLTNPVGTGSSAGFPPQPTSLAYDRDGNLLVGVSADHNGNGAVEKFSIVDGHWLSTPVSKNGTPTGLALIPVTADVPPALDLNGAAIGTGYTASWSGLSPVAIEDAANAAVTDSDSSTLTSMTVTLTSPHTGDVLATNTSGTSISQSYSGGTLSLTGTDTLAHYQQVLRTVTYNNTSNGPGVDSETVSFTASDGFANSTAVTATINMPAPSLSLTAGAGSGAPNFTTTWYNQGTIPTQNNVLATVTALSGVTTLSSLKVTLATFHTGDVLSLAPLGGVSLALTSSYSAGTLTLSGTDTVGHYQQALRFINYNNTSGGPGATPVVATFVANDGTQASTPVTATINISVGSGQVLGNRLFYNNSKYDGNNGNIAATDDAAIASDKTGYNGTGTATFANISAFNKGITGIMVDLQNGIGTHSAITAGDISFKVSPATFVATTFNQLSTWSAGPSPSAVSVRIGAGQGGSDRLEITFGTGVVKNEWLEVDVHSGGHTGLSANDVFYFGSVIGDSGAADTALLAKTDGNDYNVPFNNIIGLTTPVWNLADYTKDGKVDGSDATTAISNVFTLHYLANPTGPFAPNGGGSASARHRLAQGDPRQHRVAHRVPIRRWRDIERSESARQFAGRARHFNGWSAQHLELATGQQSVAQSGEQSVDDASHRPGGCEISPAR